MSTSHSDQDIPPQPPQPNKLNLKLIKDKCFDWTLHQGKSEEDKIEVMLKCEVLHLQWLNIAHIDNLEVFGRLEQLHLQHNHIATIENLDALTSLEYLALNHNQIKVLTNLKANSSLIFINVAHNQIHETDFNEIPTSIELLDLRGNPIDTPSTQQQFFKHCPKIELYNDQEISTRDKMEALGFMTPEMRQYEQEMGIMFGQDEEEEEEEDEYEDDFIYKTKYKKHFITALKEDENQMVQEAHQQLRDKTQKAIGFLRRSGQMAQEEMAKRVEEYRECQLNIINNIYQESNRKKIAKLEKQ